MKNETNMSYNDMMRIAARKISRPIAVSTICAAVLRFHFLLLHFAIFFVVHCTVDAGVYATRTHRTSVQLNTLFFQLHENIAFGEMFGRARALVIPDLAI